MYVHVGGKFLFLAVYFSCNKNTTLFVSLYVCFSCSFLLLVLLTETKNLNQIPVYQIIIIISKYFCILFQNNFFYITIFCHLASSTGQSSSSLTAS